MIFTLHAYERYRQFHMLGRPQVTDAEARVILEEHAHSAVRIPSRTYRGDEVWTIHTLGVELVVKRDGAFEEPVCVTVLPPPRFRGLTPLQAEAVEAEAQAAKVRLAKIEAERAAAATATAKRSVASVRQQPAERQERQEPVVKDNTLKKRYQSAVHERDVLCGVLKTMRQQLACERDADKYKVALRIAVRHLYNLGATEALAAIAEVEPGLASEAFANGSVKQG